MDKPELHTTNLSEQDTKVSTIKKKNIHHQHTYHYKQQQQQYQQQYQHHRYKRQDSLTKSSISNNTKRPAHSPGKAEQPKIKKVKIPTQTEIQNFKQQIKTLKSITIPKKNVANLSSKNNSKSSNPQIQQKFNTKIKTDTVKQQEQEKVNINHPIQNKDKDPSKIKQHNQRLDKDKTSNHDNDDPHPSTLQSRMEIEFDDTFDSNDYDIAQLASLREKNIKPHAKNDDNTKISNKNLAVDINDNDYHDEKNDSNNDNDNDNSTIKKDRNSNRIIKKVNENDINESGSNAIISSNNDIPDDDLENNSDDSNSDYNDKNSDKECDTPIPTLSSYLNNVNNNNDDENAAEDTSTSRTIQIKIEDSLSTASRSTRTCSSASKKIRSIPNTIKSNYINTIANGIAQTLIRQNTDSKGPSIYEIIRELVIETLPQFPKYKKKPLSKLINVFKKYVWISVFGSNPQRKVKQINNSTDINSIMHICDDDPIKLKYRKTMLQKFVKRFFDTSLFIEWLDRSQVAPETRSFMIINRFEIKRKFLIPNYRSSFRDINDNDDTNDVTLTPNKVDENPNGSIKKPINNTNNNHNSSVSKSTNITSVSNKNETKDYAKSQERKKQG